MSLRGTTVLLMFPGRSTMRFEVSGRWPLSLLAALLVPMSMGMAARHGWEARHRPPGSLRAGMLAGSLYRAHQPTPARPQAPAPAPARASAPTPARASAPARALPPAPARALPPAPALSLTRPASSAIRAQPGASLAAAAAVVSAAPILRAFRTRSSLREESAAPSSILRLQAMRLGESVRVRPFDDTGAPDAEAFAALSHLMRCRVTGEEIAIDPRLVRILTQLAADYDRPIQLISGHRAVNANGTSPTSQHTTGRAADIRIAGVAIEELRRRAIELGANGVGLYPEKGFVHVDVRPRPRAYWLYTQAAGEQLIDPLAPLPTLPAATTPSDPSGEHAPGEHDDDDE